MAVLTCTICNTDIGQCHCPGVDEKLRKAAFTKGNHIGFKWCRRCDKHYARCRCETPDFFIVANGVEIVDPTTGFDTLVGTRIIPDLTKR